MRILISNDDGIEAPGLARLVAAARQLSDDVWVVAPEVKHTAAGASLTMAKPIVMRQLDEHRYSCSGRPADCVVAAFAWLFRDAKKPDLVLAGINDGRNVAEDLAYSGTLGIAREASFWGAPAIGISRVKSATISPGDNEWLAELLHNLWKRRNIWTAEGHWLSINLPAVLPAGIRQPSIGRDKIARKAEVVEEGEGETVLVFPRGRAHSTMPGDENAAIDTGFATINRLKWFGETRLNEGFVSALRPQGR